MLSRKSVLITTLVHTLVRSCVTIVTIYPVSFHSILFQSFYPQSDFPKAQFYQWAHRLKSFIVIAFLEHRIIILVIKGSEKSYSKGNHSLPLPQLTHGYPIAEGWQT